MTDREMLELAAKAAGIEVLWVDEYGGCFMRQKTSPVIWDPLSIDGDALRLAVKLCLTLSVWLGVVGCKPASSGNDAWIYETGEVTTDVYAATRRAIVRSAAEIGRSMP